MPKNSFPKLESKSTVKSDRRSHTKSNIKDPPTDFKTKKAKLRHKIQDNFLNTNFKISYGRPGRLVVALEC